jgi:glycogen debranching enzyme GlgX
VRSERATQLFVGLFPPGKREPAREIPLEKGEGAIWWAEVEEIPEGWRYAFRAEGPYDPAKGLLFRPDQWLADPCGIAFDTPRAWGEKGPHFLSYIDPLPPFDWGQDAPPRIPWEKGVIYEMHIRSFTQDPSSGVAHPGTFLGMIEKIPYLQELGINAVELMPIFEWDETHCKNVDPETGKPLVNMWGYDPLHHFTPMRRFAVDRGPFAPFQEMRQLVQALHRAGIEVILDVVFNHTGEGKELDYAIHFRGLDNLSYYMHAPDGKLLDFAGCGNTVRGSFPPVTDWIIRVLRFWVEEMHIDGFRFDLASVFFRDSPTPIPPLFEQIARDPLFQRIKWIAEPWDAAGLYQVGHISNLTGFAEWNGWYRDNLRRFLKGQKGMAGLFANALFGSDWRYPRPTASINFVTSHDGFSLRDLVTYEKKLNGANGEQNKDGTNDNDSWNCGIEGPTRDPAVASLRERQMRNFWLAHLFSLGIPMVYMGDERGHTKGGNNNPYVQDNRANWIDWGTGGEIVRFVSALIRYRHALPFFAKSRFCQEGEVSWHGASPFHPDWSPASRLVAYTLEEKPRHFFAFNASGEEREIALPAGRWAVCVDTEKGWTEQPLLHGAPTPLTASCYKMAPHSAIALAELAPFRV